MKINLASKPGRWIALLFGRIQGSLAATSGVHTAQDVLKMLRVRASVTMRCSALFRRGIDHMKIIERDLIEWLNEPEYESVRQLHGSMSQKHCANPSDFERAQYVRALHSYKPVIHNREG
jgi:dihydroorotate dehydrogenase (fumarate)